MAPTLAYWKLRGLVEPIQLTMAQAGQEYENKNYNIGPAPEFDKAEWLNEKDTLGLDFPNLPYYIDGDVKITQTLAILRYLARKHDLGPKTDEETIRSDVGEQAANEITWSLFRAWYAKNDEIFEENKAALNEYLQPKLDQFVKFLGDRQFVLGDRVTYVDFMYYSTLDYIRIYEASFIEERQVLKDYLARIEALPEIEKFLKSETYSRIPITGPMAKFGAQ